MFQICPDWVLISGSTFAPQTRLWLLTSDLSHTCFLLTPPIILTDSDFFHICLFIWTVHNLIIVFSHFILHVIKSNCFGLPHCKSLESSSDSGLLFSLGVWMTYTFARTTHSYGLNYRVWCRHSTKCIFHYLWYVESNALNDISRSVLYSILMYFSCWICIV